MDEWKTRRATIKDIARAAGVDPSTVTRALQDSDRVRQSTRDRIKAIAEEMGYVPNMAARTLVNRRSGLVGLVIPDMTNPFFADLAKGVEEGAAAVDQRVLIIDTRYVETAERDAVRLCLELKVDGLVVPMGHCSEGFYDDLNATVPIVHINRSDTKHSVSCDAIGGSELIMNHLLQLGHRRIGFIRGSVPLSREHKMFAYRNALDNAGIEFDEAIFFRYDGTFASNEAIAGDIAALADPPTAIFCHNDVNAIGLIHALRQRGISVPDDISIAGHDDIQMAQCIVPALTTVAWPIYELGQESIRYLNQINLGKKPVPPEFPAPRLVVRSSTGRVRPAPVANRSGQ